MDLALSLRDLRKSFGEFKAVDGVSFDVPKGDIFGVIGPNGAGKTTTIRMIMDIIRPDTGEIAVFGASARNAARHRIGYLPEERGLYRKMKVLEMLEFQGSIKGAKPLAARKEASAWMDRLSIGDWKEKKVEELSKGMQQKIQFIVAAMGEPELLILDEPFTGMDPVNQDLFKDVILEQNRKGATILFSTHQMDTAERLCKAIALINKGKVVLSGSLSELKSRFGKSSVVIEYEGDGSFLATAPGVGRADISGEYAEVRLSPGADAQGLLRACVDRLKIRRFEVVAPTLHNIFIEEVGGAPESARRTGDYGA